MCGNAIADAGASLASQLLVGNSTLISLGLANNRISNVGAGQLATALENNSTLVKLDQSGNRVGVERAYLIGTALRARPPPPHLRGGGSHFTLRGMKLRRASRQLSLTTRSLGMEKFKHLALVGRAQGALHGLLYALAVSARPEEYVVCA